MSAIRFVSLLPLLFVAACSAPADTATETIVPEAQMADKYEIRGMYELPGTPYLVSELHKKNDETGYGSSKGGYSSRNVVLVHRETGDAVSLLPDERGFVGEAYFIPARAASNTEFEKFSAPFGGFAGRDGNGTPSYYLVEHGVIEGGDHKYDLFIGSMDDLSGEKVLSDIGHFGEYWMLDATRLVAVAHADDRDVFHVIDLAERKVISTKPVAPRRINAAE